MYMPFPVFILMCVVIGGLIGIITSLLKRNK